MPRLLAASITLLVSVVFASTAGGETWRTVKGDTIEGTLKSVQGPYALIVRKTEQNLVPIGDLDDTGISRVADFLLAQPASAAGTWGQSSSRVIKELQGKLRILKEGELVGFDPTDRPEPEYFLVYFSAHWCGPCRRFTPGLVEAYRKLQLEVPGRFEMIFISSDEGERQQEQYVREAGMPWPFVRYKSLGSVKSLERWAGNGIPCLVVLDRDGTLLFHSYRGAEYLGPQDPLERFITLLKSPDPRSGIPSPYLHRLAVQLRLRSKPGDVPPKAYWTPLDRSSYRTLSGDSFFAMFEINAQGEVEAASVNANLTDMSAMRFRNDSAGWLFLPAIKDGVAVPGRLEVSVALSSTNSTAAGAAAR